MRLPIILLLTAMSALGQPADLVLHHGKIATLDPALPTAQMIAVRGGRIAAVGSDNDAPRWIGPQTKVIDLKGMLAIPGFIEGHGHFTSLGEYRMGLDLREARTWDEIAAQVARAARQAKPGDWIVGRGWHQSKWDRPPNPNVEGFPLHASLDAVSPDNPVLLTHASGHAAFVNSRAMAIAGITRDTANPPGGEILKDAEGNPTGLLRERAEGIVMSAYHRWHEAHSDVRKAIELATAECLSKGITTFEDAGSPFAVADVNIYERVFSRHPDQKNLRWRIEHAQHLNAADIPRFGQMGVIAAMQGIHCTSDAPFVLLRLGPQRAEEGAYVWQKLMKSGAVVGNGTDAPVEDVSPIGKSRSRSAEGGRSCEPEQRWNLRRGHSHRPTGGRTDHNLPCARPNYLGTPSLITYRRRCREFGL